MKIPKGVTATCLGIDCPERKSICCGANSAQTKRADYQFACSNCGKKYESEKCNAYEKLINGDMNQKLTIEGDMKLVIDFLSERRRMLEDSFPYCYTDKGVQMHCKSCIDMWHKKQAIHSKDKLKEIRKKKNAVEL